MICLYFSGAALSGYITVVVYIKSWTPKDTRNARSRYLVVIAVIMRPRPNPNKAIININTGNISNAQVGVKDAPNQK